MEQRTLLQQSHRTARPGARERPQLPHPGGQPLCLGVDHAGRGLLPQAGPRLIGRGQTAPEQIRQTLLQLLGARGDPLGPALRPAPRRLGGGGTRAVRGPFSPGASPGAGAPAGDPLLGPVRHLRHRHRFPSFRPEQQQAERVRARDAHARTTAGERGPGGRRDVDDRPVRRAEAALAQPPHPALAEAADRRPRPGRAEFASRHA
ncbi:hypothetical protein HTV45_08735 [Streptomyces sp. CHD11]|nr:hypothetical protein [Streptomyces sp. CHD11]